MSSLLKPPRLPGNPVSAISALQEYMWEVYQSVDAALDNAANQLTVQSPLALDAQTLLLQIAQNGATTGEGLIWNGTEWVPGGNQWFTARSSNPQVSTGTAAAITTWLTPDIIDSETYEFDKTTGVLTFKEAGDYLVSASVAAESTTNPCQLEVKGQLDTGSGYSDYTGAEGYGYSLNSTQDRQQAIIPELGIVATGGDKFRLTLRDEGQATSILSCVLTAKRRY